MNNDRRRRIKIIINELEPSCFMLEEIANEEREAVENMPDGIREGERGQEMEEKADNLEELQNELLDLVERLGEIVEC